MVAKHTNENIGLVSCDVVGLAVAFLVVESARRDDTDVILEGRTGSSSRLKMMQLDPPDALNS